MTHEEIFVFNKFVPKLPLEKPFYFGVNGLSHGHIYGMCATLINAGAKLKYIYDDNPALVETLAKKYPDAKVTSSYDEILKDPEIELIASAAIPSHRAEIAIKAMESGKCAFLDKAPVTDFDQLEALKAAVLKTGKKVFVYYSEFVGVECSVYAKELIDRGVIGDVFHIDIFAPHRLDGKSRPDWFFKREKTGGIITDIGSHQLFQFLEFSGADDAVINSARVENHFAREFASRDEFDDFGDLTLTASNGVTGYIRIDWNSPSGIKTFGDVRAFIIGSKGYIELRKNCDLGKEKTSNSVFVCTDDGVFTECVSGKVGLPYATNLIKDSREGSELAMTDKKAFRAIELAMEAQKMALDARKK